MPSNGPKNQGRKREIGTPVCLHTLLSREPNVFAKTLCAVDNFALYITGSRLLHAGGTINQDGTITLGREDQGGGSKRDYMHQRGPPVFVPNPAARDRAGLGTICEGSNCPQENVPMNFRLLRYVA